MKKTLTLIQVRQEREAVQVQVEFPIYSARHDDYESRYTKRLSEVETLTLAELNDGRITMEYDPADDMTNDPSGLDYHLGRGLYSCDPTRFKELHAQVLRLLNRYA